jgi:hypothetical protein
MSGGAWMFVWLMFILKIPIIALFALVYWATRPPVEAGEHGTSDGEGGGPDHPRPRPPRPSRRGPHSDDPRAPRRIRIRAYSRQRPPARH